MFERIRRNLKCLGVLGLLAAFGAITESWGDEPMLTYKYDAEGNIVRQTLALYSTNKKIDSIKCRLLDFQPHEATVHYMLNFCEPIRVEKIARDGTFWVKGGTGNPPPFLEGMNTLSIISRNRVGLSNRQTIIIQMITTPIRVDVVWPWVSASIKDETPVIQADITPIYAGTSLNTRNAVFSLKVNGENLTIPSGSISKLDGKDVYRFSMPLPPGIAKSKNPDGTPYENRIQLNITADVNGGVTTFSNNWFFLYDTEPPTVRLFAPPCVSAAKESAMPVRLRFDDDISPLVRDVRVLVKNEQGEPVCSAYVPWQARGESTIDLPLTRSRSLLWRILLFWKNDEVVLKNGQYTMEVRCRDMALLSPEHVEHENSFQSLSADQNPGWKTVLGTGQFTKLNINAAREYFNEHFASGASPRFNVGEDSILFRIDSKPPAIGAVKADHPIFTTAFAHRNKDTLVTQFTVDEPAWIDLIYRRRADPNDTRWIVARRKQFWALDVNKDGAITVEDIQSDTLDFVGDFHLLPDGVYDLCFNARDSAENHLKDAVFSSVFTIDRTGPVITKVVSPDFILDDTKISAGAALSFQAYDSMGRQRVALAKPVVIQVKKRGSSLASGITEAANPATYEYSARAGFPQKQENGRTFYEPGAYDLLIEARDHYMEGNVDISNRTMERVEFIYGGMPPKITYPLPFTEITGMVAIKGNATDPILTNNVPFAYYDLTYAPYDPVTKKIADANGWSAKGMSVPELYGHGKSDAGEEMLNSGAQQVSEGKLLGHWDTRDAALPDGYYAIRLFAREVGEMDLDGKPTARAYDTVIVRVSKYGAPELNPSPKLTVDAPHSVVDFTAQRFASINFSLIDPTGRPYKVRVGVRNGSTVLHDTVFTPISSGGFAMGTPGSIAGRGLLLWSDSLSWHVRWNSGGAAIPSCKGVLQGNGRFSVTDSGGCLIESMNNEFADQTDAALLSVLTFDLKPNTEFVFTTTSSKMELNVMSAHDDLRLLIGKNLKEHTRDSLPIQIASGSKASNWKWRGLDALGTYPPPGMYAAFAIADAHDGMATTSAVDSFEIRTPFGIEIDRISSGHIYRSNANPNLTAKPDAVTAWYKLRCDARVTAEILDKYGKVVQTIMRDSLQTGRGEKARLFSVTWNGNRENQLVEANNRYRFRITAAAPTNNRITISDTSDVFMVYDVADIRADENVAKLDVEFDSRVPGSNGETMNLVGGGNDFQWMAQAKGKSYPEKKIPFKLAVSGMQAAATGSFQRHTVKMRRYFDELRFKVYALTSFEKSRNVNWGSGPKRRNGWIPQIMNSEQVINYGQGFSITLPSIDKEFKQESFRWWHVDQATMWVFVVPSWFGEAQNNMPQHEMSDPDEEILEKIGVLLERDSFIAKADRDPELAGINATDTVSKYQRDVISYACKNFPPFIFWGIRYAYGKIDTNWADFESKLPSLQQKIETKAALPQSASANANSWISQVGLGCDQLITDLKTNAWYEFSVKLDEMDVATKPRKNIWRDSVNLGVVDFDSFEVFLDENGNGKKDPAEKYVTEDTASILSDFRLMNAEVTTQNERNRLLCKGTLVVDPSIWANIYGRNNLVSRYSTWDSENDLYYSKDRGYINQDDFSNDYDAIPDNMESPWDGGGAQISEGERKYCSIRHHQRLKLKRVVEAPLDRESKPVYGPPLKFYSLEEHDDLSAVKGEHWQIWLDGHPDAGTYHHFRLDLKKPGNDPKSITYAVDQARVDTINIDGEVTEDDILEVWPEGILEANSATWDSVPYPLSWQQYCALNDWRTEQGGRMFQRLPPGAKRYNEDPRQKTLVPTPSLKLLAKDYRLFKTHFDSLGLPCDSIMFVSDTIADTAVLRYDALKGYSCDYKIPMALGSHGSIRSVRVILDEAKEPDLLTQFVDAGGKVINTKTSNAAVAAVRFSLARQTSWSTDDDTQLQRSEGEIYDEKDNNGNIAVDENASGTLQSGPLQYGDSRGFRMRKRMYFHEGYPCQNQADTNNSLFICDCNGNECSHKGNQRVKIESWKVSIRDISGRVNPDYEILKIHNDSNHAGGSYFVASLKDDVFFPRRLVPIHGRAHGKNYRIYFRNGSGWDRIAEVSNPDRNDTTGHRLLGFWDVTGLNGRYSLVLEVFDFDDKPVQDEITVYVGQYADERSGPCVLVGQNGRSRLTLHEKSLPDLPEKHVVTFSAVHLNEIGLSKRPQFNPVGPVISVLPSIPSFPQGKRPKAEIFFTGKECQKNNWLHTNFAFYSINADSGILQPTVSLPTYLLADTVNDFGSDSVAIPNPDSFAVLVESGRDCFMKITGELEHWSSYVVKERTPRIIYVDSSAEGKGANGESWMRAYPTISMGLAAALPGDTLRIAAGTYAPGFNVPAGVHLRGGYHSRTRKWEPAAHPVILRGSGSQSVEVGEGATIEGFKFEGFQKAIKAKGGHVWLNRCLFLNNSTAIEVMDGQLHLRHVTLRSSRTGVALSATGRIEARNTLFDCPTDITPRVSARLDLAHCRVARTGTRDSTNTIAGPAFKDSILCRLSGASTLIDAGTDLGEPYQDEAPDIGWHEYVGDTIYVNEALPIGKNNGSSWADALTGRDGLARAIRAAGAHDRILVASGEYAVPPAFSKYVVLRGGYDSQGRGIRNPIQNVTRVQGPVRVNRAGSAVSGIRIERCGGPAILADSSKVLRVENCVFMNCLAGVGGTADVLNVRYCVFSKCQSGAAITADSALFINNTFVYGVDGITGRARKSFAHNNIFYNLAQNSIALRPAPDTALRNCFYESNVPAFCHGSVLADPLFLNPQGDNFFLDRNSPCVSAGTQRQHIGALGPGVRPARRDMVCLRTPDPIRIDGAKGTEWDGYPVTESKNMALACGRRSQSAPSAQLSYAYDEKTLYGFLNVLNASDHCELWLIPKDTVRVSLYGKPNSTPYSVDPAELKITRSGNSVRVEFALSFSKTLRMETPLAGKELAFNIRFWTDSAAYLWNGDAGCMQPPASYDRIRFKDEITPRILISNVKPYTNTLVEPRVEFQYMTPQMRSSVELDKGPFRSGLRIYAEGRHTLSAKITDLTGRTIVKAETSFVMDFTPPTISASDVPGQNRETWLYDRGPVPVTERPITPRLDVRDRFGVKKFGVTVNGSTYPRTGAGPLKDGQYRLVATAEDSSGNVAEFETEFIVDRTPIVLAIRSPRQGASTRDSVIEIVGRVRPAGARIQVLGTHALAITGDTTFTIKNVPLAVGLNRLELKALSMIRSKSSSIETLTVVRDTLAPSIVEFITPKPYDTINGTVGHILPVKYRVHDSVDAISQMHYSVPGGVIQRVRGDTVEADLVMINEAMNYPITVSATDRAGNRGAATMHVIFGQPPVITIARPGPYSGTNDTSITIIGCTNDSNTTQLFINGQPAPFNASTDSFEQTFRVRAGHDTAHGLFHNANRFVIKAVDAAGFSDVETLFVIVDRDTPTVELDSPAVAMTVTNPKLRIAGRLTSDPFANVALGSDTLWQAGPQFYFWHTLQEGSNSIRLTAWDSVGNRGASRTVNIFYAPADSVIHVDSKKSVSGDGSKDRPFLTLPEAARAASSGRTIQVYSGLYTEGASFPAGVKIVCESGAILEVASGTAAITLGHTSLLQGLTMVRTGIAKTGSGVKGGGPNISIQGCTFQSFNKSIEISGGTGLSITECRSTDANAHISLTEIIGGRISGCDLRDGTNGIVMEKCSLSIDHNIVAGASMGLSISGRSGAGRVYFNTIANCSRGIELISASPRIDQNIVAGIASPGVNGIAKDSVSDPLVQFNDIYNYTPAFDGFDPAYGHFIRPGLVPVDTFENFSYNPQFVDQNEFRLQQTSVCRLMGPHDEIGRWGAEKAAKPRAASVMNWKPLRMVSTAFAPASAHAFGENVIALENGTLHLLGSDGREQKSWKAEAKRVRLVQEQKIVTIADNHMDLWDFWGNKIARFSAPQGMRIYSEDGVMALLSDGKTAKRAPAFGPGSGRTGKLPAGYEEPDALAETGDFIVVQKGDLLALATWDGRIVWTKPMSGPAKIACSKDYLALLFTNQHKVVILDRQGNERAGFGELGSSERSLHSPCDIAITSEGLLVISDAGNKRICFWGPGSASRKMMAEPDSALDVKLEISNLRFVPSPYTPPAGPGYFIFNLSRPASVKAKILDANGRPVRTLVYGPCRAGKNQLGWDGRNGQGKLVISGPYLYIITAEDNGRSFRAKGKFSVK